MNHSIRLAIFNEFVPLKLLLVADTRFASTVVMLTEFKLIKRGLQSMMPRSCDTDKPCLHLAYEMWDAMIEKVRAAIYKHENKDQNDELVFYSVVHNILVDRWAKSNTPLHCLAHSLNPR
ncbi:hypothetical protein RHMOL_Rhmol09G0276400 [Rhododendron molle]|uniref:Uncharacterized protein n=1 Tax=Rhododendron molle TaxID=49168 RepID=A0ACC0MJ71_RHOML|nr:hypothetical protein RHMOL_Rhmol09G0276400 [Rhododendron molle]